MEINDIYGYNFLIIDIRDENSFKESHLPHSINISLYKIIADYDKYLNKNNKYLLICEYGIQSKIIMEMLNRLGYHVYSLKDGYRGLIRRGKVRKLHWIPSFFMINLLSKVGDKNDKK